MKCQFNECPREATRYYSVLARYSIPYLPIRGRGEPEFIAVCEFHKFNYDENYPYDWDEIRLTEDEFKTLEVIDG